MPLARYLYQLIPEPIRKARRDFMGWIRNWLELLQNEIYDLRLVARHTMAIKSEYSKDNQRARLTICYHKIEKALSLPTPRPGFGRKWILAEFIPLLSGYYASYGWDDIVEICCLDLQKYVEFNQKLACDLADLQMAIGRLLQQVDWTKLGVGGGVKSLNVSEVNEAMVVDFEKFAGLRHSVRDFSDSAVEAVEIEKAIQAARHTPSVCNRQPWHVYSLSDKPRIKAALEHQNGNAGISENIQVLLVIMGDLTAMMSSIERNQIWVDGGMFSMSIVYALHAQGLATCCLNLCLHGVQEDRLKDFLKAPSHYRPLMMIAVGHYPVAFKVACSQRKPLAAILTAGGI